MRIVLFFNYRWFVFKVVEILFKSSLDGHMVALLSVGSNPNSILIIK